jgi:large subunit ribosomal protein L24
MKIHKGDTVQVITGKDRGKQGNVLRVLPITEKVIVQGVNMMTRHLKSKQSGKPGEKVSKEAPIHVSNVALLDPEKGVPARVGYRFEGTEKVRFSKKSGKAV